MKLPTFISNIKPGEWHIIGTDGTKSKETKTKTKPNSTNEPVATLDLPVKITDYSIKAKSSEYQSFTISVDKNNAPKVDDETEVVTKKHKLVESKGVSGYLVLTPSTKTGILHFSVPSADNLQEGDVVVHVTYDQYTRSDWGSISLIEEFKAKKYPILEKQRAHEVQYITLQYTDRSKLDEQSILNILEDHFGCIGLDTDFINHNVVSGKMWVTGNYHLPSTINSDMHQKLVAALSPFSIHDINIVTRAPFNAHTSHER